MMAETEVNQNGTTATSPADIKCITTSPKEPPKAWTNAQESLLIQFYKDHPCLWQWNHPDKYDRAMHAELYEGLQESLGHQFPVREIKLKWRKLKDIFDRCLKRARQFDTQPVWHHFEEMIPFISASVSEAKNELLVTPKTESYDSNDSYVNSLTKKPSRRKRAKTEKIVTEALVQKDDNAPVNQVVYISTDQRSEDSPAGYSSEAGSECGLRSRDGMQYAFIPTQYQNHSEQNSLNVTDKTDVLSALKLHDVKPSRSNVEIDNDVLRAPPELHSNNSGDTYFVKHVLSSLQGMPFLLREQAKLDIQQTLFKYISQQHANESSDHA